MMYEISWLDSFFFVSHPDSKDRSRARSVGQYIMFDFHWAVNLVKSLVDRLNLFQATKKMLIFWLRVWLFSSILILGPILIDLIREKCAKKLLKIDQLMNGSACSFQHYLSCYINMLMKSRSFSSGRLGQIGTRGKMGH